MNDEIKGMVERYARRAGLEDRYSPLRAEVVAARHDRERALGRLFARHLVRAPSALDVLEVGCGQGDNLLELLRWGFVPTRLVGNELLPERAAAARSRLPAAVQVLEGDATQLAMAPAQFDIVLQSTVFSSILDDAFQQRLADKMWGWVKPGGAVLWYDFTFNNPRNADVRGVPLRRVQALFPQAQLHHRRVTLAPPLARVLCRWHPALYTLFNSLPPLRTHVLAWLAKPAQR